MAPTCAESSEQSTARGHGPAQPSHANSRSLGLAPYTRNSIPSYTQTLHAAPSTPNPEPHESGPMAPMPRQWLQRVPSLQSSPPLAVTVPLSPLTQTPDPSALRPTPESRKAYALHPNLVKLTPYTRISKGLRPTPESRKAHALHPNLSRTPYT